MGGTDRWVLLRGLTRESRHWGGFPGVLQQTLGNAEVLTPDLPGCGILHHRHSPARVEDMVESYRADLTARGVAPPYRLLALSLGAMVAVQWAHRYAAEVDTLVLINTSLAPINPLFSRLQPRSYIDLLRLLLARADAEKCERIILRRTSQRWRNDDDLVRIWATLRQQCPVSVDNALRQLYAAWRYRAPATPPLVPTLMLSGARDELVDPSCSAQIARRWDLPIATHPDAGHDLPLDAPDWVALRVRDWLESVQFNRVRFG